MLIATALLLALATATDLPTLAPPVKPVPAAPALQDSKGSTTMALADAVDAAAVGAVVGSVVGSVVGVLMAEVWQLSGTNPALLAAFLAASVGVGGGVGAAVGSLAAGETNRAVYTGVAAALGGVVAVPVALGAVYVLTVGIVASVQLVFPGDDIGSGVMRGLLFATGSVSAISIAGALVALTSGGAAIAGHALGERLGREAE